MPRGAESCRDPDFEWKLLRYPALRPRAEPSLRGRELRVDPFWQDAVDSGDVDALREMIERGADVNARDRYGQTGLMRAVIADRPRVVELLLAHAADPDVTAKFRLSAVMLAAINRRVEIARLLVRAGCDLTLEGSGAPGFAGKTAHDLAIAAGLPDLADELAAE